MSNVFTGASMSLDGYISGPHETGFDHLFRWYNNGDITVPTTHPELTFQLSATSEQYFRSMLDNTGALVVGRKLFDFTKGWNGEHPLGRPVVVVTHKTPTDWPQEGTPFTFVTDGIENAVEQAKKLAGGKAVGVNGGTIASQCLNAGLLDEVCIDLVPVLLGGGTRFFDHLKDTPAELEGPLSISEGKHVTHLRYRVRYL